jgi:hypothetical protein
MCSEGVGSLLPGRTRVVPRGARDQCAPPPLSEDLRPLAALAQHFSGVMARSIASRSVSYRQYSSLSTRTIVDLTNY